MTPVEIAARAIAERRDAWLQGERTPHPYIDDATAALATLEREGWVVVPIRPTETMAIAGRAKSLYPAQTYALMIAAARSQDGEE